MRKSGSAVLLLLGFANSVDAMSRVRRGDWLQDWFQDDTDAVTAEDDSADAATDDFFNDPFFNDRIRLLNYE